MHTLYALFIEPPSGSPNCGAWSQQASWFVGRKGLAILRSFALLHGTEWKSGYKSRSAKARSLHGSMEKNNYSI